VCCIGVCGEKKGDGEGGGGGETRKRKKVCGPKTLNLHSLSFRTTVRGTRAYKKDRQPNKHPL